MTTPEIILHHYDTSPFSEKVRLMLGIKGLAWRSVIQPVIMPKPDLIPLTGGYRRIPVMQIGADIYCDSQVILAEIERRHPTPPVVRGADWAVNLWADRLWFQATVVVIFAVFAGAGPLAGVAGGRPAGERLPRRRHAFTGGCGVMDERLVALRGFTPDCRRAAHGPGPHAGLA